MSGAEIINTSRINEDQIIQRGIRDLCLIGLGIILVLVALGALIYWATSSIKERPRYSPPKVIATKKYEPRPWYPEKKVVPEQLKELSQYERIEEITR